MTPEQSIEQGKASFIFENGEIVGMVHYNPHTRRATIYTCTPKNEEEIVEMLNHDKRLKRGNGDGD